MRAGLPVLVGAAALCPVALAAGGQQATTYRGNTSQRKAITVKIGKMTPYWAPQEGVRRVLEVNTRLVYTCAHGSFSDSAGFGETLASFKRHYSWVGGGGPRAFFGHWSLTVNGHEVRGTVTAQEDNSSGEMCKTPTVHFTATTR